MQPRVEGTDEPAILMEGVNKYYGSFHALKSVDFRVASGERIVLMQGRARASQPVDRVNEHARHSDGPDLTQEL